MIHILFVASTPKDLPPLGITEEFKAIRDKIRSAEEQDRIDLDMAPAIQPDELLRDLVQLKPQIVHFSGHGGEGGTLAFENRQRSSLPVSRQAIISIFAPLKGKVRLVLFSACYSELLAVELVESIECVVGMDDSIEDKAATTFSTNFYQSLAQGLPVQSAFEQARTMLEILHPGQGKIPVIHQREDVNLEELWLVPADNTTTLPPHPLSGSDPRQMLVYERREAAYRDLWARTEPLAKYARSRPFDARAAADLAGSLREWYFQVGGLYLTESCRTAYFRLQEGLQAALTRVEEPTPPLILTPDIVEGLRTAASRLRTALAQDLGTRQ